MNLIIKKSKYKVMENNIKPNPTLIELLCSIRSTQANIQTFINDNQAEFINSAFADLAEYLALSCLTGIMIESCKLKL